LALPQDLCDRTAHIQERGSIPKDIGWVQPRLSFRQMRQQLFKIATELGY
jgi:hypothetical protein